jgi:hypothetical protein
MKSFALENIKRYKSRVKREKVAVILYHIAEALTLLALFAIVIILMGCYN